MRVTRRLGGGIGCAVLVALSVSGVTIPARADEPVAAREPQLMSETAEVTSVVDAFDRDDPWDLNLLVGFDQQWKSAKIRRETTLFQPGLTTGGFVSANENIASYKSSLSRLELGADVGIYHDFAFIFRMPLILNWSQSLGDLNGSEAVAKQLLQDPASPTGQPLFTVPFNSPNRSGLDYLAFGLDWAIFNQQRDLTKPTWVIGVEGRVPVGTPLHACNATPGYSGAECPDPVTGLNRSPGVSRGMYSVLAKTVWSRRFGYVEPYSGFWFQADFPSANSDFGKWNPQADLERTPPLLGSFGLGIEAIPYENREQFQRVSADVRVLGTYHSPGRDYSELFDELGSSQAPSLRTPNPGGYTTGPGGAGGAGVVDPSAEKIYFTGITEQQAFGSFTASASVTMMPGKYIKFVVAGGFTYVQSHLVTAADTCNPNLQNVTLAEAGPCVNQKTGQIQGVPNPDHRDVIDLPGHRFSVDDTTIVDLSGSIVVMF